MGQCGGNGGQSERGATTSERHSLSAIRDRIARLKGAIEAVLHADVLDVIPRLASELDIELRAERAVLAAQSGAIDLGTERR